MKTPEQLRMEILLNGELRKAFIEAQQNDSVAQFIAERGVEMDEKAFVALMEAAPTPPMRELSDDDMEKAVGGVNWADGGKGWKHFWEVQFVFNEGDRVYVSGGYKGTIFNRYALMWTADFYYYPRYIVKLDGYEGLYEYWQNYLARL